MSRLSQIGFTLVVLAVAAVAVPRAGARVLDGTDLQITQSARRLRRW